MEKQSKRAIIVGAFVFVALIILVLGVMTLGGQNSVLKRGAAVSAHFTEVSGLQVGNNVWFAGVKVGTVRAISFDSNGKVRVQMNIEDDYLPIVKRDATAKIGSDGFIGNKLIVLSGGSAAAGSVVEGSTLPTGTSLNIEEMMATLQENNKNLLAITTNFKSISENVVAGKGNIGKLLNDETLFTDLQNTVATIQLSALNAKQMVSDLSAYTSQLNRKGTLTNDLLTDTVIFTRLRSTVREIDALADKANGVMASLNQTSVDLTKKLNDNSNSIGLMLNDTETAANLKATIRNLQTGSQKLDENMEALQHNFLLRGFFRKKQKAQ